ncbi:MULTISPECIES: hypothetical protein [unclassified Bradyrhizobium]
MKKSGSGSSFVPAESSHQLFVNVFELVPGSGVTLSHIGSRKVREREDRWTLLVLVRPADGCRSSIFMSNLFC